MIAQSRRDGRSYTISLATIANYRGLAHFRSLHACKGGARLGIFRCTRAYNCDAAPNGLISDVLINQNLVSVRICGRKTSRPLRVLIRFGRELYTLLLQRALQVANVRE